MTRVQLAIMAGLKDIGAPYLYGAKGHLEPRPLGIDEPIDCSGETRRMVALAGVRTLLRNGRATRIEDWNGSVEQATFCDQVTVAFALSRAGIGCFLYMNRLYKNGKVSRPGHVALSLGGGYTLESRGSKGVCIVGPEENRKRKWDRAGKLPELFEEL